MIDSLLIGYAFIWHGVLYSLHNSYYNRIIIVQRFRDAGILLVGYKDEFIVIIYFWKKKYVYFLIRALLQLCQSEVLDGLMDGFKEGRSLR